MTNDVALLEQYAQTRDAEAFAELVRRYAGAVYGTCLRTTGDPYDTEDVAQECFMELARRAGSVTSSVGGWLHTLATCRSKNAIRGADQDGDGRRGWRRARGEHDGSRGFVGCDDCCDHDRREARRGVGSGHTCRRGNRRIQGDDHAASDRSERTESRTDDPQAAAGHRGTTEGESNVEATGLPESRAQRRSLPGRLVLAHHAGRGEAVRRGRGLRDDLRTLHECPRTRPPRGGAL